MTQFVFFVLYLTNKVKKRGFMYNQELNKLLLLIEQAKQQRSNDRCFIHDSRNLETIVRGYLSINQTNKEKIISISKRVLNLISCK